MVSNLVGLVFGAFVSVTLVALDVYVGMLHALDVSTPTGTASFSPTTTGPGE